MIRLAAFLRGYLRPGPGVAHSTETTFETDAGSAPATLHLPRRSRARLPGWVVLHGLTRSGRTHPGLRRFARALAASGAAVMVPEITAWRELRVRPAVAVPLIRSAIRSLDALEITEPGGVGLCGFSFGATQGLVAAADANTRPHLRGVAAWGGYRDVGRLFRFGLTGRHEYEGERRAVAPDPYGGWVMGANYLTAVPGYEACDAAADALRRLAIEAGDAGVYSGDPAFDPVKVRNGEGLSGLDRDVYALFAPPSTAWSAAAEPDPASLAFADALAEAAVAAEPLLDPGEALPRLATPTVVAHGRDDRLVPFTEGLRLARGVPEGVLRRVTITGLFAHSGGASAGLGPVGLAREARRFLGLLGGILALVDEPAPG